MHFSWDKMNREGKYTILIHTAYFSNQILLKLSYLAVRDWLVKRMEADDRTRKILLEKFANKRRGRRFRISFLDNIDIDLKGMEVKARK